MSIQMGINADKIAQRHLFPAHRSRKDRQQKPRENPGASGMTLQSKKVSHRMITIGHQIVFLTN
ncbi:hypothetical protein GCM10010967_36230 [Dyadobacter beijingensis]|uniref:Uncharacterized protein n=1 Tax=Dyadobacter beijingensis TaxID=365489 RepID=A0ABQ2I313_9BACT|nr:hypothetical protein GCM10010967_36230 [Dyadobacter beijingensis]